jgi:beta-xylosidase
MLLNSLAHSAWLISLASSVTATMLGPVQVGVQFNDTNGQLVQAHSGGIYTEGDTFYLYGNNYTGDTGSDPFTGVCLYQSRDLSNWEYLDTILTPSSPGWAENSTGCGDFAVLERPKIAFNKQTNRYVLYAHVTDAAYEVTMVGVATSPKITGPWEFVQCYEPGGVYSWDMGLYIDDDEDRTGYLIYSSDADGTGTNGALRISQLSSDYLSVVVANVTTGQGQLESPALFKYEGVYTLLVSHTSGWASNPNVYDQATAISGLMAGGFTDEIAPDSSDTYNSQTAFVLPLTGSFGTRFVYLGDRYTDPELYESSYVWLPMNVTTDSATLIYYADEWYFDTHTGTFSGN